MYLDKYFFPFGFTVKIKRYIINKNKIKSYLSYIIVRCDLKNKNKIKSMCLVLFLRAK